jgi:hypothetical protein
LNGALSIRKSPPLQKAQGWGTRPLQIISLVNGGLFYSSPEALAAAPCSRAGQMDS